jgi:hypothetical protein
MTFAGTLVHAATGVFSRWIQGGIALAIELLLGARLSSRVRGK